MANWAKLQEDLTGLPVVKRARHGIHFDKGNGEIVANFSGKPCHYEDKGVWKPIDTTLLLGADGFYGCPHSPVKVHKDGRVKVDKSDYSQFTDLPGSPLGRVDGNRIVRDFPGGRQYLYVTEDGFREEIVVDKPTFPLEKFIGKQTGTLPSAYKASPQTAVDANGDVFEITSDTKAFGDWLDGAAYPVTIDPDFAVETNDAHLYAITTTSYAASRTATNPSLTQSASYGMITQFRDGAQYRVGKAYLKFDTSTIGAGATVTQVNLKLAENFANRTVGVYVVPYDWSGNDPITTANRATVFTGVIGVTGEQGFTGITQSGTTSSNLTTSIVNKTSYTYLSVMGAQDYAQTETADNASNWLLVYMCMSGHATESKRPILSVTYTAAATGTLRRTNMNAQMSNLTGGMHG